MSSRVYYTFAVLCTFVLVVALSGCGWQTGSDGGTTKSAPAACIANATRSTNLPILFTSDAPLGPVYYASVNIHTIQLTDACGQSVTVYQSPVEQTAFSSDLPVEFAQTSGVSEPLTVAANVPDVTYTSATVTYSGVTLGYDDPGASWDGSSFYMNPTSAQVELPSALNVAEGQTAALELDLLIASPIDLSVTNSLGASDATITPEFRMSGITLASAPTNDRNGLAWVRGSTTSVDASGTEFSMNNTAGLPLTIETDGATVVSGIGSVGAMPANVPANIQLALKSDGSLYARQIGIEDPTVTGAWVGPLVQTYPSGQYQYVIPQWWQEPLSIGTGDFFPWQFQFTPSTVYSIAETNADLTDLPFTPQWASFADVLVGQGIAVEWQQQQLFGNQPQTMAHTAVLVPRSFSGTIVAEQAFSRYTAYTLQLATNDELVLTGGPSTITAYSNSGTRMEDGPLAVGDAVTLHGLVFNDGRELALVCDQTRLQRMP